MAVAYHLSVSKILRDDVMWKKSYMKEIAIYRHETQTSLLMSFWKVKLQGVVSFRRIWLPILIFLHTLRLLTLSPKGYVCIAGMSFNPSLSLSLFFFSFFSTFKLWLRVRNKMETQIYFLQSLNDLSSKLKKDIDPWGSAFLFSVLTPQCLGVCRVLPRKLSLSFKVFLIKSRGFFNFPPMCLNLKPGGL